MQNNLRLLNSLIFLSLLFLPLLFHLFFLNYFVIFHQFILDRQLEILFLIFLSEIELFINFILKKNLWRAMKLQFLPCLKFILPNSSIQLGLNHKLPLKQFYFEKAIHSIFHSIFSILLWSPMSLAYHQSKQFLHSFYRQLQPKKFYFFVLLKAVFPFLRFQLNLLTGNFENLD